MINVEAVSADRTTVTLSEGTTIPITNWLDIDGDECVPEDAVAGVAGPYGAGELWVTFMFSEIEGTLQ